LKVKEYLDLLEVPYIEDNKVVDDCIFNDWAIWEFASEYWVFSTWTRHNSLSTRLWKLKEVPATWFSLDVNIIISMLKDKEIKIVNKDKIDLYFVQLWDEAKKVVLPLSIKARCAWINTTVSLWTPSMKEQILKWTRLWAKFLVIVWIMEARNWNFQVRNMIDWTQAEVNKDELIDYIIEKIWIKNLDFYSPTKDLIIGE
jgi:histidyl-tRNA synthetase